MSDPNELLLTINTGSSSLKAALYPCQQPPQRLISVEALRIGLPDGLLTAVDGDGNALLEQRVPLADHGAALEQLFAWLDRRGLAGQLAAVGHRLVHGGSLYTQPQRVDARLLEGVRGLADWAPEHLPQAIGAIEFIQNRFSHLPQVACFDTAFHHTLPRRARLFAVPHELSEGGLLRFGFHGLSYEYLVGELRALDPLRAGGRAVLAHLGNGASLAAVQDGVCIDTSMGFTPSGGLVMGTRTGDVDPGLLVYLLRSKRVEVEQLNTFINKKSGLLGISGVSADMRDLLKCRADNPRAADAVELFCYQAKKFLAGFAAALQGLDTLVFSAGIGEHAPEVRAQICEGLEFLGIKLDSRRNESQQPVISSPDSAVTVRVIPTDEDLMIARHTARLLFIKGVAHA